MINQLVTVFAVACDKSGGFFGLIPWYQYLKLDGSCNVTGFSTSQQIVSNVPLILLAVVDDLLRIAGLVAVIYALYGSVMYVTSQGSPDQTAKAQNTIVNALIGLALAMIAVTLVSFLGKKLGG